MAYNATRNPTDFIRSAPNLSGTPMPQLQAMAAANNKNLADVGIQKIKTKGDIARTMLSNAGKLAGVFGGMQTGAGLENYLNLPQLRGLRDTGYTGGMTGQLDSLRLADMARRASGGGGGGGGGSARPPRPQGLLVNVEGYGWMDAKEADTLREFLASNNVEIPDIIGTSNDTVPNAQGVAGQAAPELTAGDNSTRVVDEADIIGSDEWQEVPNQPGTYYNPRTGEWAYQ